MPEGCQRIALGVEYNGRHFFGWQRQAHSDNTVQQALEVALSKIADQPIDVHCAGRTDSGVHGLGQVVHFDTSSLRGERGWALGTNRHLPETVAVKWAQPVDSYFHARFSATSRSYVYAVFNEPARSAVLAGKATWYKRPLDCEKMQQAANSLLGENDFSSYRATACQSVSSFRNMQQLTVQRQGSLVLFHVRANAFLYHMVRNIVGVLLAIGAGDKPVSWAADLLAKKDRTQGGKTAAPDGLYLASVGYSEKHGLPANTSGMILPSLSLL